MESVTQADPPQRCRVCVKVMPKTKSFNIAATKAGTGATSLLEMLRMICAPVFAKIDREAVSPPGAVCVFCVKKVLAAYQLIDKCLASEQRLRGWLLEGTDLSRLCRVCTADLPEGKSFSVTSTSGPAKLSLLRILRILCKQVCAESGGNVKLTDSPEMPQFVCVFCLKRARAAYQLRRNCIASDRKLLEMAMVKPELNLESDVFEVNWQEEEHDTVSDSAELGQTGRNRHRCRLCSVIIENVGYRENMRKHMSEMHPESYFKCHCNREFYTKSGFDEHTLGHQTGRFFKCSVCDQRFEKKSQLHAHADTHPTVKHMCPTCGKMFIGLGPYKTHLLRHTGKKTFACAHCPTRFYTKIELQNHSVTHSKEKPFVCDTCGSRFTTNDTMKKHREIMHSDLPPSECQQCGMKFKHVKRLKRHLFTHSGARPYRCLRCDRAFGQCNDLVKHSRAHMGAAVYGCDRCDEAFPAMGGLREHYQQVHVTPSNEDELGDLKFTAVAVFERRFRYEQAKGKSGAE